MFGLDAWAIGLLLIGTAAFGIPLLTNGRLDAGEILAGLGLAGAGGFMNQSTGNNQPAGRSATKDDPFPNLANGESVQVLHQPSERGQASASSGQEAMQRAVEQARSSYSPAGMEGALPFSGPGQGKKILQKQFS